MRLFSRRVITLILFISLLLILETSIIYAQEKYSDYQLILQAQYALKQYGYDVPTTAMDIASQPELGRVFYIKWSGTSRNMIERALVVGFAAGGVVSKYAAQPIDYIVMAIYVTYENNKPYFFVAKASDALMAVNKQITWSYFFKNCIQTTTN